MALLAPEKKLNSIASDKHPIVIQECWSLRVYEVKVVLRKYDMFYKLLTNNLIK